MGRILDYLRPLIGSAMRQLGLGRAESWVIDWLGLSKQYPWASVPERTQATGQAAVNVSATRNVIGGQSNTIGGGFPPGRLAPGERVGVRIKVTLKDSDGTFKVRQLTANVPHETTISQLEQMVKRWILEDSSNRWTRDTLPAEYVAMAIYQVLEDRTPNAAINN